MTRSHGDGRRMTVEEAVERRARMIRSYGSIDGVAAAVRAIHRGRRPLWPSRLWTKSRCYQLVLGGVPGCMGAHAAEDVAPHPWGGRFIVPMCKVCREFARG